MQRWSSDRTASDRFKSYQKLFFIFSVLRPRNAGTLPTHGHCLGQVVSLCSLSPGALSQDTKQHNFSGQKFRDKNFLYFKISLIEKYCLSQDAKKNSLSNFCPEKLCCFASCDEVPGLFDFDEKNVNANKVTRLDLNSACGQGGYLRFLVRPWSYSKKSEFHLWVHAAMYAMRSLIRTTGSNSMSCHTHNMRFL